MSYDDWEDDTEILEKYAPQEPPPIPSSVRITPKGNAIVSVKDGKLYVKTPPSPLAPNFSLQEIAEALFDFLFYTKGGGSGGVVYRNSNGDWAWNIGQFNVPSTYYQTFSTNLQKKGFSSLEHLYMACNAVIKKDPGLAPPPPAPPAPPKDYRTEACELLSRTELVTLLTGGPTPKINVIKSLRARCSISLKQAKDIVDLATTPLWADHAHAKEILEYLT